MSNLLAVILVSSIVLSPVVAATDEMIPPAFAVGTDTGGAGGLRSDPMTSSPSVSRAYCEVLFNEFCACVGTSEDLYCNHAGCVASCELFDNPK